MLRSIYPKALIESNTTAAVPVCQLNTNKNTKYTGQLTWYTFVACGNITNIKATKGNVTVKPKLTEKSLSYIESQKVTED